jgi:hypothetical protein
MNARGGADTSWGGGGCSSGCWCICHLDVRHAGSSAILMNLHRVSQEHISRRRRSASASVDLFVLSSFRPTSAGTQLAAPAQVQLGGLERICLAPTVEAHATALEPDASTSRLRGEMLLLLLLPAPLSAAGRRRLVWLLSLSHTPARLFSRPRRAEYNDQPHSSQIQARHSSEGPQQERREHCTARRTASSKSC